MAATEHDLLLLAAGFGTRLRPLTDSIPKVLLPIYGVTMLDLHIARFFSSRAAGTAGRMVVNTHHLAEKVQEHLGRHPMRDRLAISPEDSILGTGGAVRRAAGLLRSDPFLVLNADALLVASLASALEWHDARRFTATMVLSRSSYAPNVRLNGERVEAILDGARPGALTFTGLHVMSRRIIDSLPPDGFHDIRGTYRDLIARGELGGYVWEDAVAPRFRDVGSPESYLEAHRLAAAGLEAAIGLDRFDLSGIVRAEAYGFIDPRATVGADCRVERSVVMQGATIEPGSCIVRSIIAPGARAAGGVEDRLLAAGASAPIPPEGDER